MSADVGAGSISDVGLGEEEVLVIAVGAIFFFLAMIDGKRNPLQQQRPAT